MLNNSSAVLSIVIPVRNGASTLKRCLEKLQSQKLSVEIEIIILDSMSTDNSREIALLYGAKIIDIPIGTFNHGLTRNKGVEVSNGDLIYFTVQDAYLSDDYQLETMASYFKDQEIQSVTGMQAIPNDLDKNPAIWFKRFSEPVPEVRHFKDSSFQKLLPKEKLLYARWDNVNSMYRKSALEKLPFRNIDFAEDALWAMDALHRGWKLVRDSSLLAYHYHHETYNYVFKMRFTLNYTLWYYFRVLPDVPFIVTPVIRNIITLLNRRQLSFYQKVKWILHNCVRHLANLLSAIIFRLSYKIGKQPLLDKCYQHFCSVVPQGKQQGLYS